MSIQENLLHYQEQIPAEVKLIAVSKTKPIKDIMEAYHAGQRIFGENKAQDMVEKYTLLPKDIEWHYIGHLQTNKVKIIAPFVALIHAVDSLKLMKEINKQARLNNRIIDCLLQFHIAEEDTKFGLNRNEANEILLGEDYKCLTNIRLTGVMGMATFTNNTEQVRREFGYLKDIFTTLKQQFFSGHKHFRELSMGMSDDFQLAIETGSTMIRIGTAIFGARNYHK